MLEQLLAKPSPPVRSAKVATPICHAPPPASPASEPAQSPGSTVPGTLPSPPQSRSDEVGIEGLKKNNGMLASGGEGVKNTLGANPYEDGSMGLQPTAEPFEGLLWEDIPDVNGALAPKPILGQAQISPEAVRSRSRRIFTKRGDGTKKVSEEIWNDWHSKGPKKKLLEDIFKQCGYDADLWL